MTNSEKKETEMARPIMYPAAACMWLFLTAALALWGSWTVLGYVYVVAALLHGGWGLIRLKLLKEETEDD